jgi:hypothetical protein
MVILNPPLLNRSQWTPLNIALKAYQRELPERQLGRQRGRNGVYLPAYVIGPRGAEHSWSAEVTQRDQWLRLRSQYAGEVLAPLVPEYVWMGIPRARAFETAACLVDSAVGHAGVVGHLFCKESG